MKKESRKLNLNRETLIPLQDADLENINGGATWTITTSSQACIAASSAIVSSLINAASNYFASRGNRPAQPAPGQQSK